MASCYDGERKVNTLDVKELTQVMDARHEPLTAAQTAAHMKPAIQFRSHFLGDSSVSSQEGISQRCAFYCTEIVNRLVSYSILKSPVVPARPLRRTQDDL